MSAGPAAAAREALAAGRPYEAVALLEPAVRDRPANANLAALLGDALLAAGEPGRAERVWRDLLAARPEEAERLKLHARLARSAEAAGRFDDAIRQWEERLRSDPDDEHAVQRWARLLPDEAESRARILARAWARYEDRPTTRARLAIAAGRNDDALRVLIGVPGEAAARRRFEAAYEKGDYRTVMGEAPIAGEHGRRADQVARALAIVADPDAVFPEALFRRALSWRGAGSGSATDTVVITSAALRAGGAERQAALTAAGVAGRRAGRPGARTLLLARSLDPDRRHDVMIGPAAAQPALEVEDRSRVDSAEALATLGRAGVPQDAIDLVAAFPAEMSDEIARVLARFVELRPRVVHLWQDGEIAVGAVAAVLAGVPRIVAMPRNIVPSADDRRWRRWLPALYEALGAREDVVLAANSRAGAEGYARLAGVPVQDVRVVPNGVVMPDREAIATEVARARAAFAPEGGPLIGGVFRFVPAKRPELWLRAADRIARALPSARFLLVGDGELRPAIRRLAEELTPEDVARDLAIALLESGHELGGGDARQQLDGCESGAGRGQLEKTAAHQMRDFRILQLRVDAPCDLDRQKVSRGVHALVAVALERDVGVDGRHEVARDVGVDLSGFVDTEDQVDGQAAVPPAGEHAIEMKPCLSGFRLRVEPVGETAGRAALDRLHVERLREQVLPTKIGDQVQLAVREPVEEATDVRRRKLAPEIFAGDDDPSRLERRHLHADRLDRFGEHHLPALTGHHPAGPAREHGGSEPMMGGLMNAAVRVKGASLAQRFPMLRQILLDRAGAGLGRADMDEQIGHLDLVHHKAVRASKKRAARAVVLQRQSKHRSRGSGEMGASLRRVSRWAS
jgi:tetratricopeptide (TPR) repeat protein